MRKRMRGPKKKKTFSYEATKRFERTTRCKNLKRLTKRCMWRNLHLYPSLLKKNSWERYREHYGGTGRLALGE